MNRESYLKVIVDQKEERDQYAKNTLVRREFESSIKKDSQLAQIIIGVRRAGKSTLAHQMYNNVNYAYINFDDERLLGSTTKDLNLLLELLYQVYGDFKYLLLDEIQNIDGWSLFVNRLLRKQMHIIITGSNSKLLSVEIASHLTGRYSCVEIFPFSFREFLKIKRINITDWTTQQLGQINSLYQEYTTSGGFPEVATGENVKDYTQNLFDAIVTRDIVFRHNIKYVRTFRDIALFLINSFASEISYNRIKSIFELGSENTAKSYVSFLEEAYLALTLPKFSFKKQEQLRYRKIYAVDPAFISILSDDFSKNSGRILENLVYLELRRRASHENFELFYYKKQVEVDFVVVKNGKVIELIQVCESLADKVTYNREIRALKSASSVLNAGKLRIITNRDEFKIELDDCQIEVVSVIAWLLDN